MMDYDGGCCVDELGELGNWGIRSEKTRGEVKIKKAYRELARAWWANFW